MSIVDEKTMECLEKMAKEADLSVEKVFKLMRISSKCEKAQQDARRSSPDEKATIEAGVSKLFDENPNIEKSIKEIAKDLGVRVNQGNLSRISRQVRQFALTH